MTPEQFEAATGYTLKSMAHQCHAASLALVKSGVHGICRVARGACPGVPAQHSWVVLGRDCYDPAAVVIDPTFWSYQGGWEPGVRSIQAEKGGYVPHGSGNIWEWGRPNEPTGEVIELEGPFTPQAERFLEVLGPLDAEGWRMLAHAPVGNWPAGEIFAAMYADERMAPWLPIDVVGMATDLNPNGLYLPEDWRSR